MVPITSSASTPGTCSGLGRRMPGELRQEPATGGQRGTSEGLAGEHCCLGSAAGWAARQGASRRGRPAHLYVGDGHGAQQLLQAGDGLLYLCRARLALPLVPVIQLVPAGEGGRWKYSVMCVGVPGWVGCGGLEGDGCQGLAPSGIGVRTQRSALSAACLAAQNCGGCSGRPRYPGCLPTTRLSFELDRGQQRLVKAQANKQSPDSTPRVCRSQRLAAGRLARPAAALPEVLAGGVEHHGKVGGRRHQLQQVEQRGEEAKQHCGVFACGESARFQSRGHHENLRSKGPSLPAQRLDVCSLAN